jgi:hypothetical protein
MHFFFVIHFALIYFCHTGCRDTWKNSAGRVRVGGRYRSTAGQDELDWEGRKYLDTCSCSFPFCLRHRHILHFELIYALIYFCHTGYRDTWKNSAGRVRVGGRYKKYSWTG